MKKLTATYKQYLQRKSEFEITKRNSFSKLRAKKKRAHEKHSIRIARATVVKLYAPVHFALGITEADADVGYPRTRLQLLSFIQNIKTALKDGKSVQISFKRTEQLSTCGTIVFVAELEKILRKYPGKVSCDYPNDDVVEQLFQHIGLLERLGLTPRKAITAENVRHWSYVYGTTVDTTEFKSLFSRYSTELSEEVRSGLFDGMSEAVTNSFQHAYPCKHLEDCDCEKGWWMFAKQTGNLLSVVMYDMGIGIPASLERKPEIREWLTTPYRRLKKRHDTLFIDVAVESNRTSTRLPHRGKGLKEMLEFVKEGHVGGFSIYSRAGAFSYSAEDKVERGRDFEVPIKGTFIRWEIPLTVQK